MPKLHSPIRGLDRTFLGLGSLYEAVMIKKLLFLLVILFTCYAPAELTRGIVAWGNDYGIPPNLDLRFEIAFIWVLYVAAMIIVEVLIWKRSTR